MNREVEDAVASVASAHGQGGPLVLVDAGHFMVVDFRIEVRRVILGESLRAAMWRWGIA